MDDVYKKVVVPLDGSPLAEVALPYAEELAGKIGSEMVLLSVLPSDEPEEYHTLNSYMEKTLDITMRQVKKYTEGTRDCTICTATRVGNPAEGILDYVDKGHLCLVVMATHGRSGISRWAIGSVADKVVRSTTRQPLLLIRAKGAHPDIRAKRIFKKALLPLDGTVESEAVMPVLTTIAASLHMEIILLRALPRMNHSLAEVENYLQSWCRKLEEAGISSRYEVRIGSPADLIIDLADEAACDVVAMATHAHGAGSLWPLGSVAQKVLLAGNTPLLLIRE
ncbi:MAG: universal stress protein [Dehalococcoidales bacterium]|jgi:nucleotide-binding universal stress UspA family protein